MIFLKISNKKYLFGKFRAIVLFPFCFCIKDFHNLKIVHEKIHGRQFIEFFFIGLMIFNFLIVSEILDSLLYLLLAYFTYYVFYILEFILRFLYYWNFGKAYRMISFEQEAYKGMYTDFYLQERLILASLKYLFRWR